MDWFGILFLGQGVYDEIKDAQNAKKEKENKLALQAINQKENSISQSMTQMNTLTSNDSLNSSRVNSNSYKQKQINNLESEKINYE